MNERISRRGFMAAVPLLPAAVGAATARAPAPYGPLPSERQLRWHELDYYAFIHFSPNTFTDLEWGNGDEDPSIFNPTAFDADAIAAALKAGGMAGGILTAKHHDGFCLWQTATTEHSIRNSPWKGGKGDIVGELAAAMRRTGLKFGVYLSPWDRNSAFYGKPEYVAMYREQLRELLTKYGPIFEIWQDGANGGSGYYGGAKETRRIDRTTYYGWEQTWDLEHSLQPDAVVWCEIGPDIRWAGNEAGHANETCWETYTPHGRNGGPPAPGASMAGQEGATGHRDGKQWLPPECNTSIRPGWFWHEKENSRVKTPAQLMDLYYHSTGRGGCFLLNLPPDRRGLIHENDAASVKAFHSMIKETFKENLAAKAKAAASNVRANDAKAFGPRNLLDGDRYTYWSTDDAVTTPEVTFDLGKMMRFNVVRLRENIKLGQRIDSVALDQWKDGAWTPFAEATSIGACRLIRTKDDVSTNRVRLRVTKGAVCPALSEFGIFLESGAPSA
jgi:alpha-L-fucosidase